MGIETSEVDGHNIENLLSTFEKCQKMAYIYPLWGHKRSPVQFKTHSDRVLPCKIRNFIDDNTDVDDHVG